MIQGLIDIHFHGQAGFDVMSENPEDLLGLSLHLKKQGVAGFLATFVSTPKEEILAALETVKKVQGSEKGAKILGVHLEGPFLHPERKGAHKSAGGEAKTRSRHVSPPRPRESGPSQCSVRDLPSQAGGTDGKAKAFTQFRRRAKREAPSPGAAHLVLRGS